MKQQQSTLPHPSRQPGPHTEIHIGLHGVGLPVHRHAPYLVRRRERPLGSRHVTPEVLKGFHLRDETMGEDASQVRTGSASQVMAALRNATISLLRMAGATNIAAALRRNASHPEEALALLGVNCTCYQKALKDRERYRLRVKLPWYNGEPQTREVNFNLC